MPRKNQPPVASDADQDADQSAIEKTKNMRSSSSTTPIPVHLLQSWVSSIQKDNEKTKDEGENDTDCGSEEGPDQSSDWTSDSENSDDEPKIAIQINSENGVSLTYILGIQDEDASDEEDSEWNEYDDGEQSVETESDEDYTDVDSDELEEVAAVIAEMINDAIEEEEEYKQKESRKRRRGRSVESRNKGKGKQKSVSEYEPESETDEDEYTSSKRSSPVQTRSMRKGNKKGASGTKREKDSKSKGVKAEEDKKSQKVSRRSAAKSNKRVAAKSGVKKESVSKASRGKELNASEGSDEGENDEEERSVEEMERLLSVLKSKRGQPKGEGNLSNGAATGLKNADIKKGKSLSKGKQSKTKNGEEDADIEEALIKQFDETVAKMKKERKDREEKERKKTEGPQRKKYNKEFRKLLRGKQNESPVDYFAKQPVERQKALLTLLRKARKDEGIETPATVRILESGATESAKQVALRQAMMLSKSADSEEMQKVKNWLDAFIRIPFGNYIDLPIRLGNNAGQEIRDFMVGARRQLDAVAYGLDDAKTKLIEVVGQWIANPQCTGTSIALKGPMGTGKTTLIKEGLSKIIGRPFEFIALGGSTDGCTLEGHSYTYVGSTWGEIVSILQRSKCMNPVIYFDELDKISQSPKGQEISGILTHLTDTSQNSVFHDKYFAGVPLDLSRVVFVFSYNDESLVNPILLNRMHKIETKGYSKSDKAVIATKYMLPALYKEFNMTEEEVSFDEDAIDYLANVVSGEEKGVRDLKRGLTTCLAKINLLRLGVPEEQVLIGGSEPQLRKAKKNVDDVSKEDDENGKVTKFPLRVTQKLVSKLARASQGELPFNMYS